MSTYWIPNLTEKFNQSDFFLLLVFTVFYGVYNYSFIAKWYRLYVLYDVYI